MQLNKCLTLVAAALLLSLCNGCSSQNEPAARGVAVAFSLALAADDGAAACRLLAPGTKAELEKSSGKACPPAIVEEDLPEPGAEEGSTSFGTMAKVTFAGDTVFVTEFMRGWRVMAAGCSPVPGYPYDCQLQGG